MFKINLDKIIQIYLIISLIILTFVEIESVGSVPLQVFFLSQNKGYILLILTILMILVSFIFKRRKSVDITLLCLLIKCILDGIPFLKDASMRTGTNWYYFAMVVSMPMIYFVFKQYAGSIKTILNLLSIFGIVLVLQLIQTILINGYAFSDSLYKHYLRIPIAHSNIIGVVLLTILVFRLKFQFRNKLNGVINLFLISGLILTQSRGTWIFLIIWFLIIWFKKLYTEHKILQLIFWTFILVFFGFLFFLSEDLQLLILATTLSESFDISILSSGRTEIWVLAIFQWLKNPWFGSGLGVTNYDIGNEVISTGVHNMILDYAVQSGIVGVFIYGIAVFNGMKKRFSKVDKKESIALFFSASVILMYSMVEVCYFHFPCLFLFWMIIGLYNSRSVGK